MSENEHHVERQTTAGRLHTVLTVARAQPHNLILIDAWAQILGAPPGDHLEVFERLVGLRRLVRETRADLSKLRRATWFLEPFPNVESLVGELQLGASWGAVVGRISDTVMDRLFAAHMALEVISPRELPPDTLARFRRRVTMLIEEVAAADDLPPQVRGSLVELLEEIRVALLRYQVEGTSPIEHAIVFGMGVVARNRSAIQDFGSHPTVSRVFRTMGRVARVVDWTRQHSDEIQVGLGLAQVAIGLLQLASGSGHAPAPPIFLAPLSPSGGGSAPLPTLPPGPPLGQSV